MSAKADRLPLQQARAANDSAATPLAYASAEATPMLAPWVVTVPPGVREGQVFYVNVGGTQMAVTVPAGVQPGGQVQVYAPVPSSSAPPPSAPPVSAAGPSRDAEAAPTPAAGGARDEYKPSDEERAEAERVPARCERSARGVARAAPCTLLTLALGALFVLAGRGTELLAWPYEAPPLWQLGLCCARWTAGALGDKRCAAYVGRDDGASTLCPAGNATGSAQDFAVDASDLRPGAARLWAPVVYAPLGVQLVLSVSVRAASGEELLGQTELSVGTAPVPAVDAEAVRNFARQEASELGLLEPRAPPSPPPSPPPGRRAPDSARPDPVRSPSPPPRSVVSPGTARRILTPAAGADSTRAAAGAARAGVGAAPTARALLKAGSWSGGGTRGVGSGSFGGGRGRPSGGTYGRTPGLVGPTQPGGPRGAAPAAFFGAGGGYYYGSRHSYYGHYGYGYGGSRTRGGSTRGRSAESLVAETACVGQYTKQALADIAPAFRGRDTPPREAVLARGGHSPTRTLGRFANPAHYDAETLTLAPLAPLGRVFRRQHLAAARERDGWEQDVLLAQALERHQLRDAPLSLPRAPSAFPLRVRVHAARVDGSGAEYQPLGEWCDPVYVLLTLAELPSGAQLGFYGLGASVWFCGALLCGGALCGLGVRHSMAVARGGWGGRARVLRLARTVVVLRLMLAAALCGIVAVLASSSATGLGGALVALLWLGCCATLCCAAPFCAYFWPPNSRMDTLREVDRRALRVRTWRYRRGSSARRGRSEASELLQLLERPPGVQELGAAGALMTCGVFFTLFAAGRIDLRPMWAQGGGVPTHAFDGVLLCAALLCAGAGGAALVWFVKDEHLELQGTEEERVAAGLGDADGFEVESAESHGVGRSRDD